MKKTVIWMILLLIPFSQGCVLLQQDQHGRNAKLFSWDVLRAFTTAGRLPKGEHPEFAVCLEREYHKKYGTWILFTPKDIHSSSEKSLGMVSALFASLIRVWGWQSVESYGKMFRDIESSIGSSRGRIQESSIEAKQTVQEFARIAFDTCGELLPKEDRCAALEAVELEPSWCARL